MDLPGTLDELESRIRTLLPEQYQDRYEAVKPVSMGSAGLQFDSDGKVAWDEMWGSFCDLAMAGGPPHKGMLLEPAPPEAIAATPERYEEVTAEICRGIEMVAYVRASPSATMPGWIAVDCENETMAAWLTRAIVMENVSAFHRGGVLYLPAGPAYRIEKEIKNVITAIAKTSHYWLDHVWFDQKRQIGELFARMGSLLQPSMLGNSPETVRAIQDEVCVITRFRPAAQQYSGWCGLDCPDVATAIWIMRALVASNALARREGNTLFVPVDSCVDPGGRKIAELTIQVWRRFKDRALKG
jgi:hypothetical protein